MSTESNKAAARRFHELFNANQLDPIRDELFTAESVIHFPGQPPMNIEAFKQVGIMFRAGFPDLNSKVVDQIAEGDKVVTRIVSTGTHTGDFQGIPATGKPIRVEGIIIERFANGRIVERWDQFDQLGMLQQLGVIPMPQA
ncbi:MAG: ester cyclase [Chloroflexi bacterium]|nr:ester cyclase [Chloroflexota bacterium]